MDSRGFIWVLRCPANTSVLLSTSEAFRLEKRILRDYSNCALTTSQEHLDLHYYLVQPIWVTLIPLHYL